MSSGFDPHDPHAQDGGVKDVCEHFQLDLSCLVDGELDEAAAGRAMLHIERCDDCREFMEDTRECLRLHLDANDPDRLLARMAALTGLDLAGDAEAVDLVHRLATIFYQLGKAYVLAAIDPGHHLRVFDAALPVEPTQSEGRGFVDGVLSSGRASARERIDWTEARHLLNGRLEKIEDPLEKGRRLLTEAIESDPSHEEAQLYMAFLHAHEQKTLRAAREYRAIFRTALSPSNRGHAAVQLGLLHAREAEHKQALACYRWVTISGLADEDGRFFFAHFNIGLEYALLGDMERSLAAFRTLLDRYPERTGEMALAFARSRSLHTALESQAGFAEALLERCPELFETPAPDSVHSDGREEPFGATDDAEERPS